MFTKSDFKQFLSCPREFWLRRRHPEAVSVAVDASAAFRIRQGYEVQRYARELFPFDETEKQVGAADLSAKIDLLGTLASGGSVIREVKSGKSVGSDYIDDVAYQVFVARAAGEDVRRAEIVCLNGDYRRNGAIETDRMISVNDVTAEVEEALPQIRRALEAMRELAAGEPDYSFRGLCDSKLRCPFFAWRNVRYPDHTIYDLFARNQAAKLAELESRGILDTRDIPDGFPLTDTQRSVVEVLRAGGPLIDRGRLRESLEGLEHPLWFLDYETVNPAIPQFDGMAPLEQIAFQYSLHVRESPGRPLKHYWFVSDGSGVPGLELVRNLRRDIGGSGSVVVWNESFEATRNRELAKLYPEHADFLESVNARMFDLMKIFSKGIFRHPRFAGKSSIKLVLPVLVPELSYAGMDIGDGGSAMGRWFDDVFRAADDLRKRATLASLREYCRLDSLAMAEILFNLERIP